MPTLLRDTKTLITGTLPNGSGTSVTGALDFGSAGSWSTYLGNPRLELSAPALTTTQLPDAATMTFDIIASASPDLSTPTTIYPGVLVQTGAGGIGAAAAVFDGALPVTLGGNGLRYVGAKVTNSGTGNASLSTFSLYPIF